MKINDLLVDSLNGLTANDLPFILLQLFAAGTFGVLLKLVGLKTGVINTNLGKILPLYTFITCFVMVIAKNSVTVGLVFIACSILLHKEKSNSESDFNTKLYTYTSIVIGLGFGSANIVLTAFVSFFILGILLFMRK